MDKYIINNSTLVLFSLGEKTQIYEKNKDLVINKKLIDIVNESCMYYGSSFKGRCAATEYLIGIKYKCPIIISENKLIIFFPTTSYKNDDCIWFNFQYINKYYINKDLLLIVELINNKKLEINTSLNVFNNQILKSARLDSIIKSKY